MRNDWFDSVAQGNAWTGHQGTRKAFCLLTLRRWWARVLRRFL